MKKIISLYQRNFQNKGLVDNIVTPGAEWVIAGERVAARKFDGTCCLIRHGKLYKRYEVKKGKTATTGFEPACEVDPNTGKQQGWLAVGDGPEDQYHREAFNKNLFYKVDGTYELVGPKIQGNPENWPCHSMIPHGIHGLPDAPTEFNELQEYLKAHDIEGIVWHHPDGRMVKITGEHFGIKRQQL